MDWEHNPLPEAVRHAAVLVLHAKSGIDQVFQFMSCRDCGIRKRPAGGWSPAKAVFFHSFIQQSALVIIGHCHRLAFTALELVAKEFVGKLGDNHQTLLTLSAHYLLGGEFFLFYFDMVFLPEVFQGFGI